MSRLHRQIYVDAPPDKVWEVLSDLRRVACWAPTVAKSYPRPGTDRGPGAARRLYLSSGEVVDEIVVAWEEGHSLTLEVPHGLEAVERLQETWTVEPAPTSSVVRASMAYKVGRGVAGPLLDCLLVRRILREILTINLAGLKFHIETGASAPTDTDELPLGAVE